jgi:hypothetical protein
MASLGGSRARRYELDVVAVVAWRASLVGAFGRGGGGAHMTAGCGPVWMWMGFLDGEAIAGRRASDTGGRTAMSDRPPTWVLQAVMNQFAGDGPTGKDGPADFVAALQFKGRRQGYFFAKGAKGLG